MPHDPAHAALAELVARLRGNLDDEATWSVMGDLLAARGDARGELIALDQQLASLAGNDASRLQHAVLAHRVGELASQLGREGLGPLATASNLEVTRWKRGFALAATIHGRPAGSRSSPGIVDTLERLLVRPCAPLLRELVIPRASSCSKAARLLARAAFEQLAIVESLSLPHARCERFAALAELEHLHSLALGSTQVPDLATLRELPRLASLDLSRSHVDLRSLAEGFDALRTLDLRGYPLEASLEPLRSCVELRELDLGEAQWRELEPLAPLRELERLHLRSTEAFDLRPLAGLSKLAFLDLRGSPVSDLEPLAGLELEELRIGYTRVRDLRPLRTLRKLAVVELAGTPVKDLGPLLDLPALTKVDIKGSEVCDVEPLLARGVQVIGRPPPRARTWRDLAEDLLRG